MYTHVQRTAAVRRQMLHVGKHGHYCPDVQPIAHVDQSWSNKAGRRYARLQTDSKFISAASPQGLVGLLLAQKLADFGWECWWLMGGIFLSTLAAMPQCGTAGSFPWEAVSVSQVHSSAIRVHLGVT